jgi:hypothetical protein
MLGYLLLLVGHFLPLLTKAGRDLGNGGLRVRLLELRAVVARELSKEVWIWSVLRLNDQLRKQRLPV